MDFGRFPLTCLLFRWQVCLINSIDIVCDMIFALFNTTLGLGGWRAISSFISLPFYRAAVYKIGSEL